MTPERQSKTILKIKRSHSTTRKLLIVLFTLLLANLAVLGITIKKGLSSKEELRTEIFSEFNTKIYPELSRQRIVNEWVNLTLNTVSPEEHKVALETIQKRLDEEAAKANTTPTPTPASTQTPANNDTN